MSFVEDVSAGNRRGEGGGIKVLVSTIPKPLLRHEAVRKRMIRVYERKDGVSTERGKGEYVVVFDGLSGKGKGFAGALWHSIGRCIYFLV